MDKVVKETKNCIVLGNLLSSFSQIYQPSDLFMIRATWSKEEKEEGIMRHDDGINNPHCTGM